jgi:hypothetical protein
MRIVLAVAALLAGCDNSPATEMAAPEPPQNQASLFDGGGEQIVWIMRGLLNAATPKPQIVHRGLAVRINEGALRWEHIYPAAAAAIPELRKSLDEDREETLGADRNLARAVWNEQVYRIKNPVKNPKPISLVYRYQVVADLPHWLSLSVRHYDDRSNQAQWTSEYLWDKRAKKAADHS